MLLRPVRAVRPPLTTPFYPFTATLTRVHCQKRPRSTMSDCQLPNKRAQYEPKPIVYGMAKNGAEMRIQLDDKETNICELLRQVSDFVAAERPDLPRIESRIAGGWVRDKVKWQHKHLYVYMLENSWLLWFLASRKGLS